jgi:hypothetical protein
VVKVVVAWSHACPPKRRLDANSAAFASRVGAANAQEILRIVVARIGVGTATVLSILGKLSQCHRGAASYQLRLALIQSWVVVVEQEHSEHPVVATA